VTPILLDTGVIVALLDRDEDHHDACKSAVEDLRDPLVTSEIVIAEACHLLRKISPPAAVDAVLENVERGTFRIPLRLDANTKPIRALMKRYARVPRS
jgi:uncharacterized protein